MIVPKFWSEARLQERIDNHQVTMRRFGWSNLSQTDADEVAGRRVAEAMARRRIGEKVEKREHKVAYNGAEGIPIREEIVIEFPPHVVTRNSYGALCLNTPNVLFADVDFKEELSGKAGCSLFICAVVAGVAAGVWLQSVGVGILTVPVVGILIAALLKPYRGVKRMLFGSLEQQALRRIRNYFKVRPSWSARIYRTPAGIRVLVTHRTFATDEPDVAQFFNRIGADRQYVQMCVRQKCFRARLTAKPWRIGIPDHIRPRPGVWPINPERMPERVAWLKAYDQKAERYAACVYLETLGGGLAADRVALTVQAIHDEYSRATTTMPLG